MRFSAPFVAALALQMVVASPAPARKLSGEESTCPFSGQRFLALGEMSGTQLCLRLDFKPIGFIGAPPRVPICPDHGFPVYRWDWSPSELERLRPWVESAAFRTMAANESPYFRIAQAQERLAAPAADVAWSYLAASWQVEDQPDRYWRYLEAALSMFDEHLSAVAADPALATRLPQLRASLLAAEIERRLGRFDAARNRLRQLDADDDPTSALLLQRQRELGEQRDSGRHYLSDGPEIECAELDRQAPPDRTEWQAGEALPALPAVPTKGPLSSDKLRR